MRRLEHGDWLNVPWGVVLAPLDFGRYSRDLLVGQFGGGRNSESAGLIAGYDLASGRFDGLVEDTSGNPLGNSCLWGLSVGNVAPNNSDPAGAPAGEVYFAARPNGTGDCSATSLQSPRLWSKATTSNRPAHRSGEWMSSKDIHSATREAW